MPRDIAWGGPILTVKELEQQGVERWQTLSTRDAAYFARVSHSTIYSWIKWGWLKEGEHYIYNSLFRTYKWDIYRLYELAQLGVSGRKKLKKYADPDGDYIRRTVQMIRDDGWTDDDVIDMTVAEAAELVGLPKSTLTYMMTNFQITEGSEYCRGVETKYAFIMGKFIPAMERWKKLQQSTKKKRRSKEKEPQKPRRRSRVEQLQAIREFEGDYVPPSERQDLSDVEAIRIQERAEKGTARLLGSRGFRGRPSVLSARENTNVSGDTGSGENVA